MIEKYLSFALVCLLLITTNASFTLAQNRTNKIDLLAVKIKTTILKRGTGEKKRVEVKMLDGRKLKGYINGSGEDSFTLVDSKTRQTTSIAYSDVEKVNNRLTKGDKIALGIIGGAAAVAAIVLVSFVAIRCKNEGGC